MFTTKVVRLTIKVNLVKNFFLKNRKKSDQNGIKWNKLELQLQSKNVYNKSCQAYHKSKFGQKNFSKKLDQNGIKWNKLELQLQSKNIYNKSCQAYHKSKFGQKNSSKKLEKIGSKWNKME